jgi:hypothetical protein
MGVDMRGFVLVLLAGSSLAACGSSDSSGGPADTAFFADDTATDSALRDTKVGDTTGIDTATGGDTSGIDTATGSDTATTDTSATDTSGTDTSSTDTSSTDTSPTDTGVPFDTAPPFCDGTSCPSGSTCTRTYVTGGACFFCGDDGGACPSGRHCSGSCCVPDTISYAYACKPTPSGCGGTVSCSGTCGSGLCSGGSVCEAVDSGVVTCHVMAP